ncbi:energy transducer TonB [Carboxylicivirga marina]|uniref:TonB family protein n=1 Tax=Carboxylicivirga marina TaxID=2800988 RepID=A0ABS1HIB3_9BACT|nr:energy transducer TonB [Carboxylicivirga marina]MBK3517403.1 TonB family protein [Carboxylicivirga marina]
MKVKKHRHADLENKRSIFFQIGLIVALGASLAAFEWGSDSNILAQPIDEDPYVEDVEMIPITHPEEPKTALPKPIPLEKIIIVDNTTPVVDDLPDFSSEDTGEPVLIPEMAEEIDDTPMTFYNVQKMPQFPGGSSALLKYIAEHVKYPVICAEAGVTGKVYVSFVVNEKGNVVEAKVVRSPDANLSTEALRVISGLPQWTPGKQRDKAVRVAYTIPVNFVLN